MNIGIAGLGTVGAEVARQLLHHRATVAGRAGEYNLIAVSARSKNKDRGFPLDNIAFEEDPMALAQRSDIDIVVELIGGDEGVAFELVHQALSNGKSVVTANKALLAKHGAKLAILAEDRGVCLAGEASVAGGIPALKILREGLAGNRIERISGILNGTCNYILSTMETSGRDFDDVLAEAQELGYAEADPGFDIDGIDAAHKLALLGAIGFGSQPHFDGISIEGIRSVSALDIESAQQFGYAIRLLAIASRHGDGITASVRPTLVPLGQSLAKVDGALNAVAIESEPLGQVISIGPGAGAGATASAVLADIIEVLSGRSPIFFGMKAKELQLASGGNSISEESCFYMRLMVKDEAGVLAEITSLLRDEGVSVSSMIQPESEGGHIAAIVLTTHEIKSSALTSAIAAMLASSSVLSPPVVMRILN